MGGHASQPDLVEVNRFRKEAVELLRRLLSDRARLEIALAESGRRDAMKWVTGRSALDNAIDTTRTAIAAVDRELIRHGAHKVDAADPLRQMREMTAAVRGAPAPIGA